MGGRRIPGITPPPHEQTLKKADFHRLEQTRRVGWVLPPGGGINFRWHGPSAVRRTEIYHALTIIDYPASNGASDNFGLFPLLSFHTPGTITCYSSEFFTSKYVLQYHTGFGWNTSCGSTRERRDTVFGLHLRLTTSIRTVWASELKIKMFCTKWVRGFREWQIYIHRPNHPLRRVRYGYECENEHETLTPSTTKSSPQTYRLALLARKTTGPARSFGCPHLPAGIRSEICCNLTGSFNNFSFLVGGNGRCFSTAFGDEE